MLEILDVWVDMWLDDGMTTTKRPYRITAVNARGFAVWAGGRTRTFGTVDAARTAAFKLGAWLAETDPDVVGVEIRLTNGCASGPLVELVEVTVE